MNFKMHVLKILAVFAKRTVYESIIGVVIIAGIVGYGEYRRNIIVTEIGVIKQEQQINREGLETRIATLENELLVTKEDSISTTLAIQAQLQGQQSQSASFEQEINKIAGTVGTLDKLSKTDEELLQKYSKVYFLNEHYVPIALAQIDSKYIAENHSGLQVHANILSFLNHMLSDAEASGFHLRIASAFRSFGTQSQLKASYRFIYGADTANQFSADQGYSEHQLGTTVDIITPETAASFTGFDLTDEYSWLLGNAYKYGFIISYPNDNEYYQYEPWHWRFVGVALATRLHNDNKNFYDFDQREINKYLANIFD